MTINSSQTTAGTTRDASKAIRDRRPSEHKVLVAFGAVAWLPSGSPTSEVFQERAPRLDAAPAVTTLRGMTAPSTRLTVQVRGRVQGVGFRMWTRARATELGLVGWASNLPDGRVEVVVEGDERACRALLDRLESADAPGRVLQVRPWWGPAQGGLSGFAEK